MSLSLPTPPAFLREPVFLGGLSVPSRFFLAPLAGYTSLAFRLAVRRLGGLGLATTDLVNARSIMERRPRSFELAETCPEDRPLAIQIYGHVIAEMEHAAKWVVDHGASAVDINMGCPVNKVVKTGGGSALMCQADAASRLVEAVVQRGRRPCDGQDAARLGRCIVDGPRAGPVVRAGRRGGGDRSRSDPRARVSRRSEPRGHSRRWSRPSSGFPSWPTATSARSPTPPECSRRPAARRSRLDAGRCRTRSSFASSRAGPRRASPAPSPRSTTGST